VFSGGVAGGLGAVGSGNSLPRISRIGADKTFFLIFLYFQTYFQMVVFIRGIRENPWRGLQAAPAWPADWAWARLGPRLRTRSRRIRSSKSTGVYIPLGRKTSARVSRS
jgi:hypothetical protein